MIRRPHYHKMMICGKWKKKMVTGKLIPISKERMWPLCIVSITYSLQTTNLNFDEKTLELYKEREFQYLYV